MTDGTATHPALGAESSLSRPALDVDAIFGGRYRRVRRIGVGGMADVYEVEHATLGAHFAAKVLRPGRDAWESTVRRFVREARLLGKLRSEHIVRVTDLGGIDGERPYYVMELLDGQDLRALLGKTEISLARAVKIIVDACEGVGVAHAAGLVHRDLKPENLFVTYRDSGEELCKLLDFGVSKGPVAATTETGALIGTVTYMAPEQIESAGTVTARADVYALGAILYETLARRPPHVADSVERLLYAILRGTPEPIATHRAGVPAELDRVVLRALARDPAQRFATVAELADALLPFVHAPEFVTNDVRGEPFVAAPTPAPRARVRRVGAALVLVAAAGALALLARRHVAAPPSADWAPVPTRAAPALKSSIVAPPPPAMLVATAVPELERESAPAASVAAPANSAPIAVASKRVAASPRASGVKRSVVPASASADAMVASAATRGPLPKIQFDLQNPYGR